MNAADTRRAMPTMEDIRTALENNPFDPMVFLSVVPGRLGLEPHFEKTRRFQLFAEDMPTMLAKYGAVGML